MATIGLTAQEKRLILMDEGVFKNAAIADDATLVMYWGARDSSEYQRRLATLQTP
jgi:hypothetical protein